MNDTNDTAFSKLVELCTALKSTTKRTLKRRLIAAFLRTLKPQEISPAVLLITGSIFAESDHDHTLDVGWRTLRNVIYTKTQTSLTNKPLTIVEVHEILEKVAESSGSGSRKKKEALLSSLFGRLTENEGEFLTRFIFGEPRTGVWEGVMLEAVADSIDAPISVVGKAHMLTGDLGEVARLALTDGESKLETIGIRIFTPVKPMLADMSYDIGDVIKRHGGKTAFEFKFDGARIQVHREDTNVRIYSRRLSDVTSSLPDVVDKVSNAVSSREFILDGEAVAVGENGRPLPFQDLMRRFRRVHEVEDLVSQIPLRLHFFDVLRLNGRSLIDESYERRWNILSAICDNEIIAERIVTGDLTEAQDFLQKSKEAGHEGLMAKRLNSAYTPGVRGKSWFKIKPAETMDLVVVAADWGHGRRTGWLSNYHLAAWDEQAGAYKVIGKTFEGLTDKEFDFMTEKLQELKVRETQYTVYVRPRLVVEVDFNEIQKSRHYVSGFALRFARIRRIREDKKPEDAETLATIKELYEQQFEFKAKAQLEF